MDNEEILKHIMGISVAVAEIKTEQANLKEMIASDSVLVQKEQALIISKVNEMEKSIKEIKEVSRHELEEKYESAKEEFKKIKDSLEDRIKDLEKRVDDNEKFKIKVTIAVGLVVAGVAFANQILKLLGY